MSNESSTPVESTQPSILSYVKDIPNLLSLSGLACTVLADGLVARRLKGRTSNDAKFGGQLDVVIDIVSYGVTPAILLLSYGNFEILYLVGAFIVLAASAIRLSYFSTYGLAGGTKYTGLALDNNSLILVFVFLLESVVSNNTFSLILLIVSISLAILNVSEIKTPKLSGNPRNVYLLISYTLVITIIYGGQFLFKL